MSHPADHTITETAPQQDRASDMHAVQYARYGAPDVLQIKSAPVPEVPSDKVLVRVQASSINAADVAIRAGKFKLVAGRKFPRGTGFDFVGRVAEVGRDVTDFRPGDPVWGLINTGARLGEVAAAAEYVLARVDWLAAPPTSLDPIGAAALPGAAGAALGVLNVARIAPGDRVLIRGAAGGVGSAAVQLASALGATVTALVRSTHLDRIRELGARHAYDYAATKPSELDEYDVIIDTVGTGMRGYRRRLARGGRYLSIAIGRPTDVLYMLASRVFGSRRIRFVKAPPDGQALAALAQHVDDGDLRPVIDSVYPLTDIAAAHRVAESGGAFGKQVIQIG